MTKVRLDAELVRRGLARSRSEAGNLIRLGRVLVRGMPADRPATLVGPGDALDVARPDAPFVSRGGEKLRGALDRFDVAVAGRRWLDAGASTGGFTDCLLQVGATAVIAVDVGYGQLDWSLRRDERVIVLERTNVRYLSRADLPFDPDGIVADLSFISLELVLPALVGAAPAAEFVLLVKPQFEAGKEAVGKGGVVRDPQQWLNALEKVARRGEALGLGVLDAAPATPAGPSGNREFFLHLRPGERSAAGAMRRAVDEARP